MTSPLLVLERTVALSRALTEAGIGHAVGGALALAYHVADPRGTNDIDVNVTSPPDQPEIVFRALPPGIRWDTGDVTRATRDGQVRLLWPHPDGEPARPIPVDLFLPQHELHSVASSRSELVPMLDAEIPILSATDLTIFKSLFDRTKDWADIEELLRYGDVDQTEVLRWLAEIVGRDDQRLQRFRQTTTHVGRDVGPPVAADLFARPPHSSS